MLNSDVGALIREAREQRRITQTELAFRTGYAGGTVTLIENGYRKASDNFIEAVAAVLDVTPASLRGDEPMPNLVYEEGFAAGYEQALADATLESLAPDTGGPSDSGDCANASPQALAA